MDVIERTLYNGLISGLSLDGIHFFYPNTLQHDGVTPFNQGVNGRSPWFNCSCCPSNLSRFVPSVAGYAYAVRNSDLYINLFMNSKATMETDNGMIEIGQHSGYPWTGDIDVEILSSKDVEARILLRIPGWARNQPVPSDLFRYESASSPMPLLLLNGKEIEYTPDHGYVAIERRWKKGDVITLKLPMEVKRVRAHEKVAEKRGRVALEYGPIVYCAEESDNSLDVLDAKIGTDAHFETHYDPQLLGGINVIEGAGLKLIPYYAWANRSIGKMNVWFFEE
jgi:DUF1680 family protein